MKRICVVGSLSYDLVMRVPRRPQKGETIIGTSFNTFVGGKGNNQALAAARCGAPVSFVGKVGKDSFGDQIEEKLKESGVDCRFLFRDPEVGTGIADILVDADGDNSISIAPQANARLTPQDIDNARDVIALSKFMLMQLEIPLETVIHAAKLAKKLKLTVVLNPAPAPTNGTLPDELLANVDLITPNQTEAELLTGVKVVDITSAIEAAKILQAKGLKQVIITMGEQGALLVDQNSSAQMTPAFEVAVQDTTAAGDAFCGSLLAAMARGETMENSIIYACAAGALATIKLGAEPSLPSIDEIKELAKSHIPCASAT